MSLPESEKSNARRTGGRSVKEDTGTADSGPGDITRGRKFTFRIDPPVFWPSVALILGFVVWTLISTESVTSTFSTSADWLKENLGWFYILGVTVFLVFLIWIAVSRFGRIRLGGDDERPEHSTPTWFGMLFAAGIGTILMFWGVAEPLNHFANPPMADVEPQSADAAREAMAFTFYHFGLHTWTIFALPGLAFAYFIYKRKLPARLSSILAPLIGTRIYGPIGHLVDVIAVVGTVFGVAVSIGLGTMQISAGLNRLYGIDESVTVQVLLIVIVSLIACVSVALGLDKGIKRLSNLNIGAAVLLLVFVLFAGPTLYLLRGTIEAVGAYFVELPRLALWNDTFEENPGWQGGWTVFYWAWTICWSPFVGMFVARISRGRSVRQFIAGVIGLPTVFVIIWFSIFGRAGFELEASNPGVLSEPVVAGEDPSPALFILLEQYPLATVMSVFALLIIMIFFVTSIDSAAMVTDMMSTGEENKAPTSYRILWGIMIGAVAGAMLVISGESGILALQEVVILIGVPFFFMHFVMMWSLVKGMSDDHMAVHRPKTRRWGKTDTPEKLAAHEAMPAPGYDEDGNELPPIEYTYDEDGTLVIAGDVRVEGEIIDDPAVDPAVEPDNDIIDDPADADAGPAGSPK